MLPTMLQSVDRLQGVAQRRTIPRRSFTVDGHGALDVPRDPDVPSEEQQPTPWWRYALMNSIDV